MKYWGKAAPAGEEPAKHLLVYHSLDVAAVGTILLESHPTLLKRFARLMGLDEELAMRWHLWLLAHHDIGKFAAAFQRLRPDLFPEELPDRFRYSARHDTLGYLLWRDQLLEDVFPWLDAYSPLEEALLTLLRTSSGHHGKPPHDVEWRTGWFSDEDIEAVRSFSVRVSRLIFSEPLPPRIQVDDERAFEHRIAVASWTVAGFAVLCDWIGSNRIWFPFIGEPIDLETYWERHALAQAQRAVEEAAVLPSAAAASTGFAALFGDIEEPTSLQHAADTVVLSGGPQLFLIEDLTGSGKTEAALTLAGRLLADGAVEGLYVALPTTATADAMYSRVGDVYPRMFEPGSRPSLVLAHSRRDLSRKFRQSVGGERIEPEASYSSREQGAAATCSAWLADNRKKALLAQVGVGTIDQVLLAVLNVRHETLRAFGLLGKLLLVDEVHACDAYMNRLLQHLLRLHAAAGGSAILLSATLPLKTRRELVDAFTAGAGFDTPALLPEDYPQLLAVSAGGTRSQPTEAPPWSRRTLRLELVHDPASVSEWLADRAGSGACVCWVRNTVRDANEAYDTLVEKLGPDRVTLFHARFTLGDRLGIEEDVLHRFGKVSTAQDRRGRIVIATQVIEQSLDLDFDEMVSDLAPVDLLLQRAGRLRRHRRDQEGNLVGGPDRRGGAVLHVLTPEPVDDPPETWIRGFLPGTSAVYRHHGYLWRTARFLVENPELNLPHDLRNAIETVFSETSTLPIPDGLQRITCRVEGQWRADISLGELNAIALEQGYGGGWGSWTDAEDTRTRLGEATVTLRLARWDGERLEPWFAQGPKPWALSEVTVRRSLACDRAPMEDPDLEEAVRILEARDHIRDAGRLLVPVVQREEGAWEGEIVDTQGRVRNIRYYKDRGLEVL